MTTTVSIVIPSRLDPVFMENPDELWLDRAIESIGLQTADAHIEVIVGLDRGTEAPQRLIDGDLQVSFAVADDVGQASAINVAVKNARGDYLAMLEDDDRWQPRFLEHALQAITECEFVSSNQLELPPNDLGGYINDFATPSGWFMRRSLWSEIGEMDPSYRYHLDNDWLGRLSDQGNRRVHLVEFTAARGLDELEEKRPFLHNFITAKPGYNFVVRHAEEVPLVLRTVNPHGGISMIRAAAEARARSEEEQNRLRAKFGRFPYWQDFLNQIVHDAIANTAPDPPPKSFQAHHLSRRDIAKVYVGTKQPDHVDMLLRKSVRIRFDDDAVEPVLAAQFIETARRGFRQHIDFTLFDDHMIDTALGHGMDDGAQLFQLHRLVGRLAPEFVNDIETCLLKAIYEAFSLVLLQRDVILRNL